MVSVEQLRNRMEIAKEIKESEIRRTQEKWEAERKEILEFLEKKELPIELKKIEQKVIEYVDKDSRWRYIDYFFDEYGKYNSPLRSLVMPILIEKGFKVELISYYELAGLRIMWGERGTSD